MALMPRVFKIGDEEFEEIPREASAGARIVSDMWKLLGRPKDPLSASGEKLMKIIIAVWEDLWPLQAAQWHEERKEYQNAELSISEQVHRQTGRSLASYPLPVYQIMKKVFPGFDASERKNCMKMVKRYPIFRMANKV